MSDHDVARLNTELNDMIRAGRALDAFERFYAEDVVMMENDVAFEGKDTNRKREQDFFGSIVELHGSGIGKVAVGDDTAFCEQWFEATFTDGRRIHLEEVSVRTWRDGKVVRERFYYAGELPRPNR
jgi:ketosteroid isomerase-like protein